MIRQTDRAFGLTFFVFFAIIFVLAWWVFNTKLIWLLIVSGLFLILSILVPSILLPFNRLWAVLVARLSVLSNHIILGSFFIVFLLPAGLIMRLIGRDSMQRVRKANCNSYWAPVNRQSTSETLPDMF